MQEDEPAPCEDELYVVDESLGPVQAILRYSASDFLPQRLAYIKGIAAVAPHASASEVQQLVALAQGLWSDEKNEEVRAEALRQLPAFALTFKSLLLVSGVASSSDASSLDRLLLVATDAFEQFLHQGNEDGVEDAVCALEALLPLLPRAQAWATLRDLLRPLQDEALRQQGQGQQAQGLGQQAQGPRQQGRQQEQLTAEACTALLKLLCRGVRCLLVADSQSERLGGGEELGLSGQQGGGEEQSGEGTPQPAHQEKERFDGQQQQEHQQVASEPQTSVAQAFVYAGCSASGPSGGVAPTQFTESAPREERAGAEQTAGLCANAQAGPRALAAGNGTEEQAEALILSLLEACAGHSDYAVQEALAVQLPPLVMLLPARLACELAPRLALQLSQHPNWKVRQAVATSLPALASALAAGPLRPAGEHQQAPDQRASPEQGAEAVLSIAAVPGADAAAVLSGAQLQLGRLLAGPLAGDGSHWVRTAAQCAAGPLLCATVSAAAPAAPVGSGHDDSGKLPAVGSSHSGSEDPSAQAGCKGPAVGQQGPGEQSLLQQRWEAEEEGYRSLALRLLQLFAEAVLSPRPPSAPVLVGLAGCLGDVAARAVPALVGLRESRLDQAWRVLLGCKESAVAAAAIRVLPNLVAAALAAEAAESTGRGAGPPAAAEAALSLVCDLLTMAEARVGEHEVAEALAGVLPRLARALPPGPGRRRLLPLLPLLCGTGGQEEPGAAGRQSIVCGRWRVRLAVAEQLEELGECVGERGDGEDEEGGREAAAAVAACAAALARDPVWRVRQQVAGQAAVGSV